MSITAETRRVAYDDIRPQLGPRQDMIYWCLVQHGPMTADRIMSRLGMRDPNSVRPRLTELRQAGMVRVIGKGLSGDTNKMVALWEATTKKSAAPSDCSTESDR